MNKRILLAGFIILLLCLSGCSSSSNKLPHYGAFLEGEELLPKFGDFNLLDSDGIPDTSLNKPTVLLWQQYVDLDLLIMYEAFSGQRINYNAKPGKEGVLEITPVNELSEGVYCLMIGNNLMRLKDIQYWCFSVDGGIQKAVKSFVATQEYNQAIEEANFQATVSAEQTMVAQTQIAIERNNNFWVSGDGVHLYDLAAKSQELLIKALRGHDSSLLNDLFLPAVKIDYIHDDSNFSSIEQLINCDYQGDWVSPKLSIFTGGEPYVPYEYGYEPKLYDENHAGLIVLSKVDTEYTFYCSDENLKEKKEKSDSTMKYCYQFVNTNKGWLISEIIKDSGCSIYEQVHVPVPENLEINKPTLMPAKDALEFSKGLFIAGPGLNLYYMILNQLGKNIDLTTDRNTYPVSLEVTKGENLFFTGWCASSSKYLAENKDQLTWVVKIDGEEIDVLDKGNWYSVSESSGMYCDRPNIYLKANEPGYYNFQFIYRFKSEVNDGMNIYAPGDLTFDVNLRVW